LYIKIMAHETEGKFCCKQSRRRSGLKRNRYAAGPVDQNGSMELDWTPDGKGLTWMSTIKNAQHIMLQPLAGGPPVQLTHFEKDPSLITHDAWSHDEKKLAITRQKFNARDIMMFTSYRRDVP
jgi:hypothetical protein